MGRIRTIKPEFPQSESVGRLSRDARFLFIQLWTLADDDGRLRGVSRMLASLLYPYDEDAPGLIEGWLEQLEREPHICRYEVEGHQYIEILNWKEHQKIDHPSKSKLPSFAKPREEQKKPREKERGIKDQGRDQGKDHGVDQGREADRNLAGSPAVGSSSFSPSANAHHDQAEMIATAVIEQTGLTGWRVREQLVKQAEWELRATAGNGHAVTIDELRDAMARQWKKYDACVQQERIRLPVTPERFYGDGKWKNSKSWGFKKGMSGDGIVV